MLEKFLELIRLIPTVLYFLSVYKYALNASENVILV